MTDVSEARKAFEFWLQTPHKLNDPYDAPASPGDVFLRFMRMIDEVGYAFVPKVAAGSEAEVTAAHASWEVNAARWKIQRAGARWTVWQETTLAVSECDAVAYQFDSEAEAQFFKRDKLIRAALTAAAQVRAGAPKFEPGAAMRLNFIADQVQSWLDWSHESRSKEHLTTDGDTAIMALPVPIWPKHGSLQNWVKALREGAMIASLWQADRATEPDSGPSVLGIKRGEE